MGGPGAGVKNSSRADSKRRPYLDKTNRVGQRADIGTCWLIAELGSRHHSSLVAAAGDFRGVGAQAPVHVDMLRSMGLPVYGVGRLQ